jgi:hypothetical protein
VAFGKDDLATVGNRLLRMKYKMSVQGELEETLCLLKLVLLCLYFYFYENGLRRGYRVKPQDPGRICQVPPNLMILK